MCDCFHRAVFLNLMLTRAHLDSSVLDGRVIETKDKLERFPAKTNPIIGTEALGLEEGEYFEEPHVWNVVLFQNKYFLVDSAFLIDNKPLITEIKFDNELRNTFTIDLPNGKFRHYLSTGKLSVESLK
jgi:hypothetical protein